MNKNKKKIEQVRIQTYLGTEVLAKHQKRKVEVEKMILLRRVKCIIKKDKFIHEQKKHRFKIESIQKFVEQIQLGWWRIDRLIPIRRIWEIKTPETNKIGK